MRVFHKDFSGDALFSLPCSLHPVSSLYAFIGHDARVCFGPFKLSRALHRFYLHNVIGNDFCFPFFVTVF